MYGQFFLVFVLILVVEEVKCQNPSPCPDVFTYEARGKEDDRWYGVISLRTQEDLSGVWVHVSLDRPAELLGNWFGEATSSDNQEYIIKNPSYQLEAGPPVTLRFFVKYNSASTIPSVTGVRLNGKTICSSSSTTPRPSGQQLHISQVRPNNSGNRGSSSSSSGTSSSSNTGNRGSSVSSGTTNGNRGSSSSSSNNGNRGSTTSTHRTKRPSTSGFQGNDYDNTGSGSGSSSVNNVVDRPTSSNSYPSSQQETYLNVNDNYENNRPSSSSRPSRPSGSTNSRPNNSGSSNSFSTSGSFSNSGSSSSNSDTGNHYNENHNSREPNYGSNSGSGSSSSGLGHTTGGHTTTTDDYDFFPGDFALSLPVNRPVTTRPSVLPTRKPSCGTVAMRPSPLITYGQNTTEGQWPWHAALYHSQGIQLTYTCGASLLSEYYVITAAHCVTKPQTSHAINPQNLLVYLGKHNLKKFGPHIQDMEVEKITVHPNYNSSVFHNDLAILKLGHPAEFTNYVRPVCLWEENTSLDNILNRLGTVVGWGFDQQRKITSDLMQASMPIVKSLDCVYSNPDFFSRFTFDKSYCAGFRNGTSVCNGDSGGGMVFPKTGTNGHYTVWQLRGLVSVGVALQGQTVCDTSHFIVFTDVAKHLEWIRSVMNN